MFNTAVWPRCVIKFLNLQFLLSLFFFVLSPISCCFSPRGPNCWKYFSFCYTWQGQNYCQESSRWGVRKFPGVYKCRVNAQSRLCIFACLDLCSKLHQEVTIRTELLRKSMPCREEVLCYSTALIDIYSLQKLLVFCSVINLVIQESHCHFVMLIVLKLCLYFVYWRLKLKQDSRTERRS